MQRSVLVLSSVLLLAACSHKPDDVGSVAGGDCQIAHTPQYVVKGRAPYDQKWIDVTTEALVSGCRQPRPLARPQELDAQAPRRVAPAPVKKKKHWYSRQTS